MKVYDILLWSFSSVTSVFIWEVRKSIIKMPMLPSKETMLMTAGIL